MVLVLHVLLDEITHGEQSPLADKIYNFGYRVPRFATDFDLLLQTDSRLPGLLGAHCSNLSEEGFAADVDEDLEIGTSVTAILTLPGTAVSLRIAAMVTNRHLGGYGFAFIFSSQNDRSYLRAYLAARR